MMNKTIALLLLLVATLSISGCQQFSQIKIQQADNNLHFNFEDVSETKNSQYILYDIAVSHNDCPSENCVYWEVIRDPAYFDNIEYPLVKSSISYGNIPDAMQTTIPPKALITGEYSVAASVAAVDKDRVIKSYKVFQSFKLNITDNNIINITTIHK